MVNPVVIGFSWYSALFVISSIVTCIIFYNQASKKLPKYQFIFAKECLLMLRVSWGIPAGYLTLGCVCLLFDFKAPRDDILYAVMGFRTSNFIAFLIFSVLLLFSILMVLNAYALCYNAREKFKGLFPSFQKWGEGEEEVSACLVGVWNGFWGPPMYTKLGKIATMTCVDEWTHASTENAIENMVAEGVPEGAIESVKITDYKHLPLPSKQYDVVCDLTMHIKATVEEKQQALEEIIRILKPNGSAVFIVPIWAARKVTSLMNKTEFTNITTDTCWSCLPPMTFIKGIRPEGTEKRENKAHTTAFDTPSSTSIMPHTTVRVGGSITLNKGMSINDGANVAIMENDSLLGKASHRKPTHQGLRFFLMFFVAVFMAALAAGLFIAWPTLDVPSSITNYNRITSGWLISVVTSFVLIWVHIGDALKEHSSTKEDVSSLGIISTCLRYSITTVVLCAVFNGIMWFPSFLVDWYSATHQLNTAAATGIKVSAAVVIIYTIIKVSKCIAARQSVNDKK